MPRSTAGAVAASLYTLYLVTDEGLSRGRSQLAIVQAAIRGGVTIVQYRQKQASTLRMIEEAGALRRFCREAGIPFIVNDRIDVALAVGADGVHVGQEDMPASLARRLIGKDMILGVSAGSAAEAQKAVEDGADYIGASPVFATPTKPDAPPPLGREGLRSLCRAVHIPVVAIGGMNAGNAASMREAGAAGVAVVSAIVAADDVESAARALRAVVEKVGTR
ncbi:MAG: thiamine phosphate synthase [Spirochaetia bacterium]